VLSMPHELEFGNRDFRDISTDHQYRAAGVVVNRNIDHATTMTEVLSSTSAIPPQGYEVGISQILGRAD
jgi:hypothetical protein